MSSIVFATNASLSFVEGLARWISPPPAAEAAPAAEATPSAEGDAEGEAEAAAEAVQPSEFEVECVALEEKGEFKALGERLLAAIRERFGSADEGEVEVAYTLLLQLLLKWGLIEGMIEALADELASSTDERPALRRTLLLSLYGLVSGHGLEQLHFAMLSKLLLFCARCGGGSLDLLLGGAERRVATVEDWVGARQLSEAQKRELWGLILDASLDADAGSDELRTYESGVKYLSLHSAEDVAADAKLRSRLVKCVLLTMRSPALLTCDTLAQLPVTAALKADPELAPLARLLDIVAREMACDFLEFAAVPAHAAFLEAQGLDTASLERKMRLLSLTSLCISHKELTYAAVAEALRVSADEVEHWVVETISAGLIVAKMDQVRSTVVVSGCLEREFGKEQLGRLQGSLEGWAASVQSLLKVVADSKPAP